jgi:hypothetical protein
MGKNGIEYTAPPNKNSSSMIGLYIDFHAFVFFALTKYEYKNLCHRR